jgi:uncharacterized protein
MTAAAALVLVIVVVLATAWTFQRRMIYFPFGEVPSPAEVALDDTEQVTFTTSDGVTLRGWFVPARPSPARFTVVVFNGNAGNRAYRAPLATGLRRHGLAVLLFDYRGYGGSGGTPTERGLAADALAVRAYLAQRPDVDPQRLVYFGESLGSGVAVTLAAEHPPAALVLRSPFTSLTSVGQFHYPFLPVRWGLRDRFASIDRIAEVRSPVLVIAGDRDGIIPVDQSRRLYEAAVSRKSLVVISGADHNDPQLIAGPEVVDAVIGFLNTV